MKIRIQTLWRIPVLCMVSGLICFYLTVYLGRFFFAVKTVGDDGSIQASVDPVRAAIFHAVLFLIVLFVGGFWVVRSMTKTEAAVSAGIASGIYLLIVFVQLIAPDIPPSLNILFAYIQEWKSALSSILMRLTDSLAMSAIISSFAPLLFILFGRAEK